MNKERVKERVSKYFKPQEFGCKHCGHYILNEELLTVLDDVREHFSAPTVITSGTRCTAHNKAVGGAVRSQHLYGTAADIKVQGVSPSVVHKYLVDKYPDKYGIGKYNTFTHVDVRNYKARW